jgi:hypothetical protein
MTYASDSRGVTIEQNGSIQTANRIESKSTAAAAAAAEQQSGSSETATLSQTVADPRVVSARRHRHRRLVDVLD